MKTTVSTPAMAAKKAVLSTIFKSAWALKKRYDKIVSQSGANPPKQFIITFSQALKEMWGYRQNEVLAENAKKQVAVKTETTCKIVPFAKMKDCVSADLTNAIFNVTVKSLLNFSRGASFSTISILKTDIKVKGDVLYMEENILEKYTNKFGTENDVFFGKIYKF